MTPPLRPRAWKAALSVFRIQCAEGIQYRAAALSGVAIGVFWALIEITVFIVFFMHGDRAAIPGVSAGMSLDQVVSYAWLAQILHVIQPMSIDGAILRQIDSGDIGVELCRPFPLYQHWFARNVAGSIAPLAWRGTLILVISLVMPSAYRLGAPASIPALCAAVVSMGCAALLCAAFATFAAVIRMNVAWGNGPMNMVLLAGGLLSGAYLPLQLWPDFMQRFLLYQPFAGYLDIPARLYLGVLPVGDAWFFWAVQLAWSAFFIAAGRLMMIRRLKNIVVQGG